MPKDAAVSINRLICIDTECIGISYSSIFPATMSATAAGIGTPSVPVLFVGFAYSGGFTTPLEWSLFHGGKQ